MITQTFSANRIFQSARETNFLVTTVTEREKEVLRYMSMGHTSQSIASTLFLSEHTVISHRKNLMIKLDARNSAHLIMKSVRLGLL